VVSGALVGRYVALYVCANAVAAREARTVWVVILIISVEMCVRVAGDREERWKRGESETKRKVQERRTRKKRRSGKEEKVVVGEEGAMKSEALPFIIRTSEYV
jgi:hypothetical protein